MAETAIYVKDLEKVYKVYHRPLERYLDFFLPKEFGERFYAVQGLSFTLEKGRSLGLVGLNGSGKSTLANMIAGAAAPTGGVLETRGSVAMTSISSGVNLMMTGLENITQKCLLLGLDYKTIRQLTPEIIEFSELGECIDQKVKTYSSGMRSKLGFAISINVDPDILVIDEALSVGDPTFTQKCLKKMRAFRERGKTIVFVSHAMPQIRDFCDQAMWLEGGRIRQFGGCKEVTDSYGAFVSWYNGLTPDKQKEYRESLSRKQVDTKYV